MVGFSIGNPFSLANMIIPKDGPKVIPARLDFSSVDRIEIDGEQVISQGRIEYIQSIYIDNADNSAILTLTCDLTRQRIICPATSQGNFSVFMPNNPKFVAETGGGVIVPIFFANIPLMPAVWYAA